jgi:hypothetical protein
MKTILFTLTLISSFSLQSMACEGKSCPMNKDSMKGDEVTPEKRAEMAKFHMQIAECLNNKEKLVSDCHKLMAEHMAGQDAQVSGNYSCSQHKKMQEDEAKSKVKK